MEKVKLFLASSAELAADRDEFEKFIRRRNDALIDKGVYLQLTMWEDFLDAMSRTRLQDEYNKAVKESDIFVMLFFTKVGRYTEEEFDTAFGQFTKTGKPLIYTFFRDSVTETAPSDEARRGLEAFKKKLADLGHFYTRYENLHDLLRRFGDQLDKLADAGFIEFDASMLESGSAPGTSYEATVGDKSVVAQGAGASVVGPGGVSISGNNTGGINTGTKIDTGGGAAVEGSVNAGGHFIGRDFVQIVQRVVRKDEEEDEPNSVIAHYLYALSNDLAGLNLGEIDVTDMDTKREPLKLADVYVPLATQLTISKELSLDRWLTLRRLPESQMADSPRESRRVPTLEALARHERMTLLGNPGSGKSTFGARVLLALAQAWQGHEGQLAGLGETWTHGALLPIRVVLQRFADFLPPGEEAVRAGDLWAFIEQELIDSAYGLSPKVIDYVQRIAREHGALFLFDGLDECGSPVARKRVLAGVDEFMTTAGPRCRFLLTARPYAWPEGPDPERGVYAIGDLDDQQVETFVRRWYEALEARRWLSPRDARNKLSDLLEVRARSDLEPLTRSPLLLTLMASLHANRGRMPDDRANLYDESVDLLMLRWNRQIHAYPPLLEALERCDLKLSNLREVLEELAYRVHEQAAGKDPEGIGRDDSEDGKAADVGEDRLIRAFSPLFGGSRDKAAIVVDYVEKRAGLLIGQGEKDGERQFTFPHRTFQEFLAACFLTGQPDFAERCAKLARSAPAHWLVVLPLAARLAKAERGASAADELVRGTAVGEFVAREKPDAADWNCALLAGMQLTEIGVGAVRKGERTRAIANRVAGWLTASLPVHPDDGGMPLPLRASAGDVLAELGDPRFDPERFHLPDDDMLGFVHVLADPEFRIGTSPAQAEQVRRVTGFELSPGELNDSATPCPEFYIARYPVTVAQIREFVAATGFKVGDSDVFRDPDTRPARWTNWHEARAYGDWLQATLAGSPALASSEVARLVLKEGWQVALPSELEWEKAACGGIRDAIWPWGDLPDPERANVKDSGIDETSAVGCVPATAGGVHDLAGNLYEWTRSVWGTDSSTPDFAHPYDPDDSAREDLAAGAEFYRVVRGGSWFTPFFGARSAFRVASRPANRSNNLGFRLVLRRAPVA